MKLAFAGLRHSHIYDLYAQIKEHEEYTVLGGFEENEEARLIACARGIDCHYKTLEELLNDEEVEIVVLGGCYGDRGQMAIQSLQAGKHVIADKPLCTSLEELDEIERLAKEKEKQVSCMLTMRYEPIVHAVKSLVEKGTLGEINNVYIGGQHPLMYGRRPMWYFEEGKHGGVINDIAIHGIDILSFMLDMKIEKIDAARCWNAYAKEQPDFKDCGQMMLTANNGAGILSDVSYSIPDGIEFDLPCYWRFYIWGTKGTIEFALADKEISYYETGSREKKLVQLPILRADYMTDFWNVTHGVNETFVTMQEVFESTRQTLLIQQEAK